jgi:hypothetical protein
METRPKEIDEKDSETLKTINGRYPTIDECNIDVWCEPEQTQIEGNASAIDDDTDKEIADNIGKELEYGNDWAWCTIFVKVEWNEFSGMDTLCCCSYKSRNDFIRANDYYQDMKGEAYRAMCEYIDEVRTRLSYLDV